MKKVPFIAGVLAVSMLAGGVTAYTVGRMNDRAASFEQDNRLTGFASNVGSHFTAYEADGYPDLTYAAENAVRGVVYIEVEKEIPGRSQSIEIDPFEEFFGFRSPQREYTPRRKQGGVGSGVIISTDGYIVTNNHVVENATKVKVTLNDKRTFDAKVIGTDPTTDVALIKIEAEDLPTIPFGDADALRLGEWVLAIGNPFNLQSTVTAGIVSAKARNLGAIPSQFSIESFIQTDAAVNQGNSGGALVNTKGELVGINTLIQSPNGAYAGYAFAVPTWIVKKVVMDIKEFGVVQRAVLGVLMDLTKERQGEDSDEEVIPGAHIVEVLPDGAAAAAGIKEGDIVVEVEGVKIDNAAQLTEAIAKHRPNDKVKVSVKRGSDVKQFDVVLRNKAGNTEVVTKEVKTADEALGGTFGNVPERLMKSLKIDGGVQVISIEEGGVLAQTGIRRGYIITHINGRAVESVNDLNRVYGEIKSIEGVYPDGRAMGYSRW